MKTKFYAISIVSIVICALFVNTCFVSASTPNSAVDNPAIDSVTTSEIAPGHFQAIAEYDNESKLATVDSIHNDMTDNQVLFTDSNSDGTDPTTSTILQDDTGTLFLENETTNRASINNTDLVFEDLEPAGDNGDMALHINNEVQMISVGRNIETDDFYSLNYREYVEDPEETREIIINDGSPEALTHFSGAVFLNWTAAGDVYFKRGGGLEDFLVHIHPDGTVETFMGTTILHENDGSTEDLLLLFLGADNANVTHFAGGGADTKGLTIIYIRLAGLTLEILISSLLISIVYITPTIDLAVTLIDWLDPLTQIITFWIWGYVIEIFSFALPLLFILTYILWSLKIEFYFLEIVIVWFWWIIHWIWIDIYIIHIFIEIIWFVFIFKFQWFINVIVNIFVFPIFFWIFFVPVPVYYYIPIIFVVIKEVIVYPEDLNVNLAGLSYLNGTLDATFFIFDIYGNPVQNADCTFEYKGVSHSVLSDSNGLADFTWDNADGMNESISGTVTWYNYIVNYEVSLDVGFPECQECEECEECEVIDPILGLNPNLFTGLASGLGVLAVVGLISILLKKKN